jgi:indole-3-glycerol phosphate synthase
MILDDILGETKHWVASCRERVPVAELERQSAATPPARSLAAAIRGARGIGCIAEFKRRSPSKGWIFQKADVADVPILRKDFLVDRYQVVEARAAGADAVLLIVAALTDEELRLLLDETHRFGMEALVETHDSDEVARALAAGARIVGVNHRDLRTFTMNMNLAAEMRPLIPADRVVVGESGIRTAEDVVRLKAAGIDAILVGETLMTAKDPAAELRQLLGRV